MLTRLFVKLYISNYNICLFFRVNVNNVPVDTEGKPWPSVYVFPRERLRSDIPERLDEGVGNQDRRIKKAIVTALFDDLMMYKTQVHTGNSSENLPNTKLKQR